MDTAHRLLLFIACSAFLWIACPALAKDAQFTTRAIWVDASSFGTRQTADKMLDRCRRAKINVILPNVMTHGSVFYKSSHYLHNVAVTDSYDPLAYVTAKAHAMGMQVHAWFCVYYEGAKGLPPAHPEWLCTDMDGMPMDGAYFMSPQIPGVNDYILSVMKDSLAYDIDGIQLDYIRYYGSSYDYSEAGRKPFVASHGFDPADFLDAAESIVPPAKDPFPVRVMHAKAHLGKPWETTWIESLMDKSGVGFGFISDSPASVDKLRAPGALVMSQYFAVSPEMTNAIERYVKRGGSVLWMDCPAVNNNPALAKLLGVQPETAYLSANWRKLESAGTHSLRVSDESFKASGEYAPKMDTGTIVARFDSGQPAVIVNAAEKGRTVLICFNTGSAATKGNCALVSNAIAWLRSESGLKPERDLLAAKRAEWLKWKADCVTDIVKRTHDAVKAKNPKLALTVAGGFEGGEYYTCARDGKRWMAMNLLDAGYPMDYCDSIEDLRHLLDSHKLNAAGKLSMIYPGLGLYTSKTVNGTKTTVSQDPKVLQDQLILLREQGYSGFALFCTAQLTEEQIGVLAEAAK